MFYLLLSLCFAEDFDHEITVSANSNYSIYVNEPKIISKPNGLEIRDNLFFEYISLYKNLIKEKGLYGYYSIEDKVDIYNSETITFEYDDCDFKKDTKKCCYQNDMWLLEPTITFNENQIVTSMIMYDSSMQPISQATHTSNLIVKYKEKKKVTTSPQAFFGGNVQGRNCGPTSCSIGNVQNPALRVGVRREVEDLDDEKKVFKPKFIESNVRQASMSIMNSIRIE